MDDEKFEIGDSVRLRSGSRHMTIIGFEENDQGVSMARCTRPVKGRLQEALLPVASLEKSTPGIAVASTRRRK